MVDLIKMDWGWDDCKIAACHHKFCTIWTVVEGIYYFEKHDLKVKNTYAYFIRLNWKQYSMSLKALYIRTHVRNYNLTSFIGNWESRASLFLL